MSSVRRTLERQWVPIAGGSCDIRMGPDGMEQASRLLRDSVGRPRLCVVVIGAGADHELVERLSRQVADAGFRQVTHVVGAEPRTMDAACGLMRALEESGATSDDLCCAMGDADLLSLASYVCDGWCAGMSLVGIPLDEIALLEGALAPRGLDVGSLAEAVLVRPCARHVLLDLDLVLSPSEHEPARLARVLMASAAMASSERDFSALWDAADKVMEEDGDALASQLMAAAKLRGRIASSTAAAVRTSMEYGQTFARACATLVGPDARHSVLLAEGLRFGARISVAQGRLSVDDMLAQDELLEALGIGQVSCDVDPDELVGALRQERFCRTNRFMLAIPHAIGRVRLTTVEDELLQEHAQAWCDAHGTSPDE